MILIKIYFLLGLIMNVVIAIGCTNAKFVEFLTSKLANRTFDDRLKSASKSSLIFATIELILLIIACNA